MPVSKRRLKNGSLSYQATDRTPRFPSTSKSFSSISEAKKWLADIHAQRQRGLAYDPKQNQSMTLAQAIEKYSKIKTHKKAGAKQELLLIRKWLRHPFANRAIGEILPFEFDEYVEERILAGRAGSTIRKELSLISQVYIFVRKKLRMYAVINPIPDVDLPSAAPARKRRLEAGEEKKLVEYFSTHENPEMLPFVQLAIETGLRRSEMLRLRWEKIDLGERWVIVKQARKGRKPELVPEFREFPLTGRAVELLTQLKISSGYPKEGVVFTITADAVTKARQRALAATGITNWRLHDARHETASRLAVKRVPQQLIRDMLGHKNMKMTSDYQAFIKAEMVAAVK